MQDRIGATIGAIALACSLIGENHLNLGPLWVAILGFCGIVLLVTCGLRLFIPSG